MNRPQHMILKAVGRFQYLSNDQLRRFVYGSSVLKYVQDATSKLVKEQLLQPLYLPTLSPHGRPRTFYSLTDQSYKLLDDRTLPPPPRFKNKLEPFRHGLFLAHFEASSDLLILACDLPRRDKRFSIPRFLTEAQIKKRRPQVRADGWVEFQVLKPATVMFELDRGTEAYADWEKKLRAYSRYIHGSYQQDYQVDHYPTIAVVTNSTQRLRELLGWTKQILGPTDEVLSNLLYFSAFNPLELTPQQAFLSRFWVTILNDRSPEPLLPEDIFGEI